MPPPQFTSSLSTTDGRTEHKNVRVWICLVLFACSLAFTGFYVGEAREPNAAIQLLFVGWLGPVDGHFAWFANVFLLAALLKINRPRISLVFALIALAFALSFLGYKQIIVSEAPSYGAIKSYGWGYALWVASIGYFSVAQYMVVKQKTVRFNILTSSAWLVTCFAIFSAHYFLGEASQFAFEARRNDVFEEKCKIAGEQIFRRPEDAEGVFLDPDWGVSFKKVESGAWHNDGVGVLGLPLLNSRLVLFYETRNDDRGPSSSHAPFRRFAQGNHRGIEVSRLGSAYAVVTKPFDIQRSLNVYGAEVVVKDLRDDSILGKTTYIFDQANKRFCGHAHEGRYSTTKFIHETLRLSRK